MHQALQIDEILEVVLEFIGYDTHHSMLSPGFTPSTITPQNINTSRKSLLSLALTSKSFLEPALDSLWHTQDCISNLLKLSSAVGERVPRYDDPELREILDGPFAPTGASLLYMKADLTQSDSDLLRKYAYRIKTFGPSPIPNHRILHIVHPKVFQELHILNNQSLLFPNLRAVTNQICGLGKYGPAVLSLKLLLNSATTFVDLLSPKDNFGACVKCIETSCPNLRKLCLRDPELYFPGSAENGLETEMRSMLPNLQHLKELVFMGPSIPEDVFRMVLKLPVIYSTVLTISPSVLPAYPVDYAQTIHAPHLERLYLLSRTARSSDSLIKLFENVKLPQLKILVVDIQLSSSSPPLNVRLFTEALAQLQVTPNSSRLHCLRLNGVEDRSEQPTSIPVVSPSDLHPLLQFSNLTELTLPSTWSYNLDDHYILALAKSCRHLQRLSLGDDAPWVQPSRVTLVGLQALLIFCRSLRWLYAVVDTRIIPTIDAGSPLLLHATVNPHPLSQLHIPRSPFRHENKPYQLVTYLLKLFRGLVLIRGLPEDEDEEIVGGAREYWKGVADILSAYRSQSLLPLA